MKTIYEKPTRELMKDFAASNMTPGNRIQRDDIRSWFTKNYPKIKPGTIDAHITKMTTNAASRPHYHASPDGIDDLFFQLPDRSLRLYDPEKDPAPIYDLKKEPTPVPEPGEQIADAYEFAYESDLKNFLAKNLSIVEEGLTLYEDEGINGIEYDVGGRYIDILALDRNNDFVVIELKVSRGYDRVIGQLLRYTGWIRENLAEKGQKVRGIIIARSISEDLLIACSQIESVDLFEYELSVNLRKVNRDLG